MKKHSLSPTDRQSLRRGQTKAIEGRKQGGQSDYLPYVKTNLHSILLILGLKRSAEGIDRAHQDDAEPRREMLLALLGEMLF